MRPPSHFATYVAAAILVARVVSAETDASPLTADAANDRASCNAELVDERATRAAILRAQVLLDRAWFPVGEIDAKYGANMRRAIAAFQRARDLPATGVVDPTTWTALEQDGPVLVPYQITPEDVAGPFLQAPEDMMKKAKLPALSFASPLEALAEQFHASPALLTELNPGATFDAGHDDHRAERRRPPSRRRRPRSASTITIGRSASSTRAARRRALSCDHRQPARSAAARTVEGQRASSGIRSSTTTRGSSGTPSRRTRGDDPARPEQSRRRRLDRPLEGALRHPRHAGARADLAHAVARLHPR